MPSLIWVVLLSKLCTFVIGSTWYHVFHMLYINNATNTFFYLHFNMFCYQLIICVKNKYVLKSKILIYGFNKLFSEETSKGPVGARTIQTV